jgi:molybdenum cofactor cytidylyltransferase
MGGEPKLLMLLAGRPVLRHVLDAFTRSRLGEVLVVANSVTAETISGIDDGKVRVLINPSPQLGMSASLKLAISAVSGDAAVIGLGDQPLLLASTIDALVEEYDRSRARIVIPLFGKSRGNPILFDRSLFSQIMEIRGDIGAKSVVARNARLVREVEVSDEGVLLDIDSPADLDAAQRILAERVRQKRSPAAAARPPHRRP